MEKDVIKIEREQFDNLTDAAGKVFASWGAYADCDGYDAESSSIGVFNGYISDLGLAARRAIINSHELNDL